MPGIAISARRAGRKGAAQLARDRAGGGREWPRRAKDRGQSLTELALMLPIVLVLIVGVVEVTAGFNAYITVVSSARDGARIASKGAATDAEVQALVVRDLGRLRGTAAVTDVTVTHTTLSSRTAVKVTACHDHPTLMHVPLLFPGTIHMCSSTTMPQLN